MVKPGHVGPWLHWSQTRSRLLRLPRVAPWSGSASPPRPPSDITWEPTARPDSVRGNLWGDAAQGPFAYFNRYSGGWQLPLHYHSNQLSGVIVSGTFVIHIAGQDAKELTSGLDRINVDQ